jgi:HNH endonuclease
MKPSDDSTPSHEEPPRTRRSGDSSESPASTCDASSLTRTVRANITVCTCGCWYWLGSVDRYNYGGFKLRGKRVLVHRYTYERLIGPIPDDLTLDHLACTSRRCVNPEHLQIVPRSENSTRANATRWHGVKFSTDGDSHDHEPCAECLRRDVEALGRSARRTR